MKFIIFFLFFLPLFSREVPIQLEYAITPDQRFKGLMYRRYLEENSGMLFIFEDPLYISMWMKNCHFPLSLAFLNEMGKIEEIYDLQLGKSITSKYPHRYALEVNKGWFKKNKIKIGDTFFWRYPYPEGVFLIAN